MDEEEQQRALARHRRSESRFTRFEEFLRELQNYTENRARERVREGSARREVEERTIDEEEQQSALSLHQRREQHRARMERLSRQGEESRVLLEQLRREEELHRRELSRMQFEADGGQLQIHLESQVNEANRGDCAICIDKLKIGQTIKKWPECQHSFHENCIDTWLQEKRTCPLCRRSAS